MNVSFWINNPGILLKINELKDIWPDESQKYTSNLNAISRLVIILSIVGYIFTTNLRILITGFSTLLAIIVLYKLNNKEGFTTLEPQSFMEPGVINDAKAFTSPTKNNPLMNVLLTEIDDNPERKAAAPAYSKNIELEINRQVQRNIVDNFDNKDGIDERLFKDLGDSFEFDRSMRQFHATANTEVMNDQKGFAEFCYGGMISAKEGDEMALTRSMPPHRINGGH